MGMLRWITHTCSCHSCASCLVLLIASSNHSRHLWFMPAHSDQIWDKKWHRCSIKTAASIIVSFSLCRLIDLSIWNTSQNYTSTIVGSTCYHGDDLIFTALLMQYVGPTKPETGGKKIMSPGEWWNKQQKYWGRRWVTVSAKASENVSSCNNAWQCFWSSNTDKIGAAAQSVRVIKLISDDANMSGTKRSYQLMPTCARLTIALMVSSQSGLSLGWIWASSGTTSSSSSSRWRPDLRPLWSTHKRSTTKSEKGPR